MANDHIDEYKKQHWEQSVCLWNLLLKLSQ